MLSGPSSRAQERGLAELGGLGGDIVGEARVAELDDFAADLDDAAEAAQTHAGEDGLGEEERGLDEKLELVEVGLPGLVFDGEHGLVAGGVEDEDLDGTEGGFDVLDEACDGCWVADVGAEGLGGEAASAELVCELCGAIGIGEEVDGDGVAGFGEGDGHGGAEATGGAGDEGGSGHGWSVAERVISLGRWDGGLAVLLECRHAHAGSAGRSLRASGAGAGGERAELGRCGPVGARLNELAPEGTRAVVLFFVATDCPVSNRLFPEMRRLRESFAGRGVRTWFVYPNVDETPAEVLAHQRAFDAGGEALQDPSGALVRLSSAVATPEMTVLVPDALGWHAVYSGRIDNQFVRLGLERPAATEHDGEEALSAVLDGKTPKAATGQPVGCAIMSAGGSR